MPECWPLLAWDEDRCYYHVPYDAMTVLLFRLALHPPGNCKLCWPVLQTGKYASVESFQKDIAAIAAAARSYNTLGRHRNPGERHSQMLAALLVDLRW